MVAIYTELLGVMKFSVLTVCSSANEDFCDYALLVYIPIQSYIES